MIYNYREISQYGFIPDSSIADHGIYSATNCGGYSSGYSANSYSYNSCTGISTRRGIISPFFRKPNLKIASIRIDENTDYRWRTWQQRNRARKVTGEIVLPYDFHPIRRFVNVTVENQGNEPARNCEIELRPLQKTNGCMWLSNDDKLLTWNDGNTLTTIRANRGRAVFHLVFSQESFPDRRESIGTAYCGVAKSDTSVVSWIANQDALVDPDSRDQDGLCQGSFKFHVQVATESGHIVSAHFNIRIGRTWKDLEVELGKFDKCDCKKKSFFSRK
jgi:hypothetical protein